MQEAKELWKKIQQRQGVNKWRPDLEEEYEDKEGNIYNKKTYTDLQRQGLIWEKGGKKIILFSADLWSGKQIYYFLELIGVNHIGRSGDRWILILAT